MASKERNSLYTFLQELLSLYLKGFPTTTPYMIKEEMTEASKFVVSLVTDSLERRLGFQILTIGP
jgi:hypothetical protein